MKLVTCCLVALCVLSSAACRPADKLNLVPVVGTLTLDGHPLEGAIVTFAPQSSGAVAASGTSDARGRYALATAGAHRPGAVPGSYNVTVMKLEVKKLSDAEQAAVQAKMQKQGMAMAPPTTEAKQLLPLKYRNAATSGFTATVNQKGDNTFTFDLKGK
jgi:hypothetical protein